jgi:predicted RNase H-like HicB family nuclease
MADSRWRIVNTHEAEISSLQIEEEGLRLSQEFGSGGVFLMLIEYIGAAMARAKYEIIDDEEPYYGEIPELKGIWATGKTLEECRKRLSEVIEGWIVVRLKRGLPIPPIGKYRIREPKELSVSG